MCTFPDLEVCLEPWKQYTNGDHDPPILSDFSAVFLLFSSEIRANNHIWKLHTFSFPYLHISGMKQECGRNGVGMD